MMFFVFFFFFSSRRRHTRFDCDWSSDVCSSDLPGAFDTTYRVRYPLPHPAPKVTVMIPTRDGRFLRTCLAALRSHTDYGAYEVLVIDNGSSERRALDELHRLKLRSEIRVLHDDRPFNYSALN